MTFDEYFDQLEDECEEDDTNEPDTATDYYKNIGFM